MQGWAACLFILRRDCFLQPSALVRPDRVVAALKAAEAVVRAVVPAEAPASTTTAATANTPKINTSAFGVPATPERSRRWVIAAPPNGPLRDPVGTSVVDAKRQDVYIPDRYTNAIYVYHVP